jgi:hypothetical protein
MWPEITPGRVTTIRDRSEQNLKATSKLKERCTGHSFWVYWAPFFLAAGPLLLGIPVYLGRRRHMSQPAPLPPYR